jgi:thiamine kinase-like enzyme
MSVNNIEEWVKLALKNEDLVDYKIDLHGKTSNEDGYLSDIVFVTVNGKTKMGQEKCVDLAIKFAKVSTTFRKEAPIRELFQKEIYIYDRVVTSFRKFQEEMGRENLLDYMAQCYATQAIESGELLILENLKTQGYDLWDRKVPMNWDHLKIILESYGKWHAFSFALRHRRKEIFEKLVENNINLFSYFVLKANMVDGLFENIKRARDLSGISPEEIKMLQFTRSGVESLFTDFYTKDPDHQIIMHGDCWTNNFMFKSQEQSGKPTSLRILDWQCSGLASPALDLSYFIYTCCDTEKYKDVKDLLRVYYDSLNKCLTYLGCDASKIFAYEHLLQHWKMFSLYGLVNSAFILKYSLCDSDEAPDLAQAAEQGKSFADNIKFTPKNEEVYFERMRGNFSHYVKNLKI